MARYTVLIEAKYVTEIEVELDDPREADIHRDVLAVIEHTDRTHWSTGATRRWFMPDGESPEVVHVFKGGARYG